MDKTTSGDRRFYETLVKGKSQTMPGESPIELICGELINDVMRN